MQYILDSVLTPLITPERKEVILQSVASLESLDFQAALDELQLVIEIQDGMSDSAMLLSRIDDIIYTAHNEVFIQHGVTVTPEATQLERFAIVDTLSRFHRYIIPDQLAMLFGGEFNNEEIMAHLVSTMTELQFDEIFDVLLQVDDVLIGAIRDEIDKQVRYRGQAEFGVAPVSRIRVVNSFLVDVGHDRMSMVVDLTNAGVRVGLKDFKQLLTDSVEALDIMRPADAATEILGLALISSLRLEDIEKTVRDTLNDFTDSNIDRQQMLGALKDLFQRIPDTVVAEPEAPDEAA